MNPGDIKERDTWASNLPKKILMEFVGDYRTGSTDPAAVDAFYELQRRLWSGSFKGRQSDYRCGSHQRRKNLPRSCKNCAVEYEAAKQQFPELFRKGRKGKRDDAAHHGVTGD